MKYRYLMLISLLFFVFLDLFSQKEFNVWYFGRNAGLSFNYTPPKTLLDGQLNIWEGVASICDKYGNLLFYSDGVDLWNSQHQKMNSFPLLGDFSATQSAYIVKKPGKNSIYYLFTLGSQTNPNGLNYNTIDMSLNGGLGSLVKTNIPLHKPMLECITAIKHCNGKDIWIITHEWNSNAFYIYLLTENGLNTIENNTIGFPQIINTGAVRTYYNGDNGNYTGYMKASPNGKKISMGICFGSTIEIYDFDCSTGHLSSPLTLTDPDLYWVYVIEFSPNSSVIYDVGGTETLSTIYQFDISKNTATDILATKTLIASDPNKYTIRALQLGPDNKIYVAANMSPYLSVINNPNITGTNCNYFYHQIDLLGRECAQGLPSKYWNISSLCYCKGQPLINFPIDNDSVASVSYRLTTLNDDAKNAIVTLDNGVNLDSNAFYNVNRKLLIKSTDSSDTVCHPEYFVKLIQIKLNGDTVITSQDIPFIEYPKLSVSITQNQDSTNCDHSLLSAASNVSGSNFLWSTGETTQTINVHSSGIYSVFTQTPAGCSDSASINIHINSTLQPKIVESGSLCQGSVTLSLDKNYSSYLWSTGQITSTITVTNPGTYRVNVKDENGCVGTAEITVNSNQNLLDISPLLPDGSISFDSVGFAGAKCKSINIKNRGTNPIIINDIKIYKNTAFSLPLSQFPITIDSNETKCLIICYSPSKLGVERDTINWQNTCANLFIPLEAFGAINILTANSNCDLDVSLTTKRIKGTVISINKIINEGSRIILEYNLKSSDYSNSRISLILYNSIGSYIADGLVQIYSESLNNNIYSEDGTIEINTTNIATGIYFCMIRTISGVMSIPLYINE